MLERISHLGKKPNRGGIPARERSERGIRGFNS